MDEVDSGRNINKFKSNDMKISSNDTKKNHNNYNENENKNNNDNEIKNKNSNENKNDNENENNSGYLSPLFDLSNAPILDFSTQFIADDPSALISKVRSLLI